MTKIVWDKIEDRHYQSGVSHGVLYPLTGPGVVWNGLISVVNSAEGGDVEPLYFEGIKYFDLANNKNFAAKLSAFSAPVEFLRCLGVAEPAVGYFLTAQYREAFGFSYQTTTDTGYHIHIVYNATANPSARDYASISDSPNPTTFVWNITAVPNVEAAHSASAHYVLDTRKIDPTVLSTIEGQLYGTSTTAPFLPSIEHVTTLLAKEVAV